MTKMNINCDLGEGNLSEEKMMPFIHSCSIAAGGHFGDEKTIRNSILLANKYNVKIGIHPSFPDKVNFGRISMNIHDHYIKESIKEQITAFYKIAQFENTHIHHIKFHGALYNDAVKNRDTAEVLIELLYRLSINLPIYCPQKSYLSEVGANYFPIIYEAFIDRTYQDDLSLTPRNNPNALIVNDTEAYEQFLNLTQFNRVKTSSGLYKEIESETQCIHSDSPNALSQMKYIHSKISNEFSRN